MKKLLSFGVIMLLVSLAVVTASPLPLLLRAPQAYTVLKLSDADLSAITNYSATNQKALIASMINGLDIAQDVMVHPGVKNKIPMPKLKVGNGFRPYSGSEAYRQKNLKYTDRFLEVKVGVRELLIDPEDYRSTYLIHQTSPGSSAAKKEIPFAPFMWDQVIKGVQREINDETSYKGFDGSATADWAAGTAYAIGNRVKFAPAADNPLAVKEWYEAIAATLAGESPDSAAAKWQNVTARAVCPGFESYILAGITASEIAPVATGAITATAGVAIAAYKKLFRAWSAAYRNNGIIISCSYTDLDFLLDDLADKYKNIRDDFSLNGFIYLPETNKKCIVKPATWLGTSRRLVSGPVFMEGNNPKQMNLFMATDQLSDLNAINALTGAKLWTILAGIKAAIGFNYQDPEGIKVGDQA
jgi:hypothetical protein